MRVAQHPWMTFTMQAESPVRFFSPQVGADIEFELPESGPATGLTLYQRGQTMPAPRLDDADDDPS